MKKFRIVPDIYLCDTAEEFCKAFCIGADDLVFIGRSSWKYFDGLVNGAHVIWLTTLQKLRVVIPISRIF